jgi:biopolymer transport protein ExbD
VRFERRLRTSAQIDMTPLVDVIFQLVIFFMITSVFKVAPGINVDLPTSSSAQTVKTNEMRIMAVSEDEIYVNKDRSSLKGLPLIIQKNAEGKKPEELRAILEADKQSTYQLVVSILDVCRRTGISNVSLVTAKEKPGL